MALAGTRDENPNVNHAAVQQDCQALHNAGSGRLGTVCCAQGNYMTTTDVTIHRTRSRSAASCSSDRTLI